MDEKLKPCKKCGEIPKLAKFYYCSDPKKIHYAKCACNIMGDGKSTPKKAAIAWNLLYGRAFDEVKVSTLWEYKEKK